VEVAHGNTWIAPKLRERSAAHNVDPGISRQQAIGGQLLP
jgi:hypothetical protein